MNSSPVPGQPGSLLPAVLRAEIPRLYATEAEDDPLVRAKLFTPWTRWTWYIIECDGEDLCFGLVDGFERELGYFSLKELESIQGPGGLRIERDQHFDPVRLKDLQSKLEATLDHPRLPFPGRER